MSGVFEIADGFIDTVAKHHPTSATYMGVSGHDHLMNDYSPEAAEAFHAESLVALKAMEATEPANDRERICKDTFIDEASLSHEQFESRGHLRDMNVLFRLYRAFDRCST